MNYKIRISLALATLLFAAGFLSGIGMLLAGMYLGGPYYILAVITFTTSIWGLVIIHRVLQGKIPEPLFPRVVVILLGQIPNMICMVGMIRSLFEFPPC